jgi:nucleoside 2-deoxyribosyltransferase
LLKRQTDSGGKEGLWLMGKIYLASPLGFSAEHGDYRERIRNRLISQDFVIFDTWEQKQFVSRIEGALALMNYGDRIRAFREISSEIGTRNEEGLRDADIVFAVLDGAEVDSGTASEVGFGCALGKKCYGLRTDVRNSGELEGIPLNLQVLHFIESTGGKLFRRIEEIIINP